ncbi:MAG: VWA domain-containing protein [Bacteroidales bacterium]|nr:VWA domain-containing protein [Bacteroidales bacterium]
MNARWQSDSRINIAKRILMDVVDSLEGTPNLEMALRVFGHQSPYPPIDCKDSKLEIPFAKNNGRRIVNKIRGLVPRGGTPIAYSLEQAAEDFPHCSNCRNIIILITDGIEECAGDPCAASDFLQRRGIALKPFVIGIGQDFSEAFSCVGRYFDASQESEFHQAFNVVISQALESTTAQVNLFDINGSAGETNVNMTFSDYFSGQTKYNYVHAMNLRGFSDTITLDPLVTYRMTVHTIPPVIIDSITLIAGRHNIISADAPQGQLRLIMSPGSTSAQARNTPCIVRKHGESETIHIQNLNFTERYLVGNYDIEILSMPRIHISNVGVDQSTVTTVEIPRPGIAVIQKTAEGHGSLYVEDHEGMRLIYNMNPAEKIETLSLQPGNYRVVLRSRFIHRAGATMDRTFIIESGKTTTVRL